VRSFNIGVVLPIMQEGPERATVRWPVLQEIELLDADDRSKG
jgi:hypothetical protein